MSKHLLMTMKPSIEERVHNNIRSCIWKNVTTPLWHCERKVVDTGVMYTIWSSLIILTADSQRLPGGSLRLRLPDYVWNHTRKNNTDK